MARPFAVFDIDGTVLRWQFYHAMGDELARRGLIDPTTFKAVKQARLIWKQRQGSQSFTDYEKSLVEVFDKALVGLKISDLQAASQAVFNEYKDQVYTFTRDLIRSLQAQNYLLFAISGSPKIVVEPFAAYYGFDDFAATDFEIEGDHFTGQYEPAIGPKKVELLKQLIARHQATAKGSFAVGDSDGDASMLALAEQPIAFNPTQGLFQHARQQGWRVVVERKNVIYQLEPGSGSYLLA